MGCGTPWIWRGTPRIVHFLRKTTSHATSPPLCFGSVTGCRPIKRQSPTASYVSELPTKQREFVFLHGLYSITRQIGRFLGAPASPATCFMQRKLSPKSKNVACTQKTSIPNATQSLKSAKKSCFCVVIRLKTSQNKKKLQPFPQKNIKKIAWRNNATFFTKLDIFPLQYNL